MFSEYKYMPAPIFTGPVATGAVSTGAVPKYSPALMMKFHQRKALYYCQKYHSSTNTKRKELYFKLCIRHSVKHEKLERDDKSF